MRMIGGFFPSSAKWTDDEVSLWKHLLSEQDYEAAKAAITAAKVAAKFDRVTMPDVFDRIREMKGRALPSTRTTPGAEGLPQMLRRSRPDWANLGDFAIILHYYNQLWLTKAKEQEGYRAMLKAQCVNALIVAGMAREIPSGGWDFSFAERAAEAIFQRGGFFTNEVMDVEDHAPRVTVADRAEAA